MCSNPKFRSTEYPDPSSSPAPSSPLTPTHNARTRPGSTSSRPSTRDGPISSLKPEIHIEIGSKKGKGKSYVPTVTVNMGKGKRTSTGSTYTYESPGSDASHTLRTGYPDISPPSVSPGHDGLRPRLGHRRNASSEESIPGTFRVAPGYHSSSEYDTPSLATGTTATSSSSRPIIHNSQRHATSPAETTRGQAGTPSSLYRTTEFVPREVYTETSAREERSQRPTPSYGNSVAPEITEAREKQRAETRRRQEALNREHAAAQLREEHAKHVRFEKDRGKLRAEERAQNSYALHEQRRAEERERSRQQETKEREAQAARDATKRSKPVTTTKSPRRGSVSLAAAQAAEQQRLVAADELRMQQERKRIEALEREEQMQQRPILQERQPSSLQERQQDPRHYDPRGPSAVPGVTRRNSVTGQAPALGRSNSKRGVAPQPREERQQPRQSRPPPVSFYNNPSARNDLPQARERRPSSSYGAQPFAQTAPNADPWDVRSMGQALPQHGQALPSARGPGVGHNFPQPQANFAHPQQATHRMNQAFYTGEYETDSEDDLYKAPRRRGGQ